MRGNSFESARRQGWQIVLWQALVSIVLALLLAALVGKEYFYAALSGGMIATGSSALVALLVFRPGRVWRPRELLGAFYQGTALKLFFITAGFIVVVLVLRPAFLPLFGGFIAAYSVYWFALIASALTKD